MKHFTSDSQKIGEIGENLACEFLVKQGFKIVERNYTRKWGEIDIIALKDKILHFIEVKTITVAGNVNRETLEYRPEDNMHPWKLKRLSRIVQSYMIEKDYSDDLDWQFDLITILLDKGQKLIKINLIDDLVI
ncbi:YraN family protein [Candidatus Nomurabacteria bacterium]|nr:YraN family protein [Candidatus Nomurabacteria bacterium]